MSNEHLERQIAFLVEWQAKFSADMELAKERMDQHDRKIEQLTLQIEQVSRQIEQLTGRVEQLTGQVGQLTGHSAVLTDALVSLTRHVERHEEHGEEVDARLAALMLIVERHISGHQ